MKEIKYLWMMILLPLFLLLATPVQSRAAVPEPDENPAVIDHAGLLSDVEKGMLSEKLKEISTRQSFDIVIVAVPEEELGGKYIRDYADDLFDYNGYGAGNDASGILLLLSMEEDGHGDYWISTAGYGITAFTDAGIDYIGEAIVPHLKKKNYARAFEVFAEQCDEFLKQAETGKPYDVDHMPKEPFEWAKSLLISVAAGVIIAFIVVGSMKAKLKTVQPAKSAVNYVREGSMNVRERSDIFLYRNITRHARPKENSSSRGGGSSVHTSSSGRSHGGGGGRF